MGARDASNGSLLSVLVAVAEGHVALCANVRVGSRSTTILGISRAHGPGRVHRARLAPLQDA